MNPFNYCHVERFDNGLWYIMYPDCTKAWSQGYKTIGWANRTLKWLQGNG